MSAEIQQRPPSAAAWQREARAQIPRADRPRSCARAHSMPQCCRAAHARSGARAADRAAVARARHRRRSPAHCSDSRYQPSAMPSAMYASSVMVPRGAAPRPAACCRRQSEENTVRGEAAAVAGCDRRTAHRAPGARCRAPPARCRLHRQEGRRSREPLLGELVWRSLGSVRITAARALSRGAGGAGQAVLERGARDQPILVAAAPAACSRVLSAASSGSTVSSAASSSRCGITPWTSTSARRSGAPTLSVWVPLACGVSVSTLQLQLAPRARGR